MEETTNNKTQYLLSVLTKTEGDASKVKAILDKEEAVISLTEPLGQRELAHPIAGERQLFLTSYTFQADPSSLKKIDEDLRHESEICRFLVTKWKITPEKDSSRKKNKKEENV